MKRKFRSTSNSMTIAAFFFAVLVLLLAGGLFLKLFLVLRASSFDGVHQYIIEIDESKEKGALIAFNPSVKSITALFITGKIDTSFGTYLGVPVDASLQLPLSTRIATVVQNMLLHASHESGMTIVDKIRLMLFVNSVKPEDFHTQSIALPIDASIKEKLLPTLFLDNTLYADNEAVAVVNATGESGVGSGVAHELSVIGINVVSVTTADAVQNTTVLAAVRPGSYTVDRIQRLFHVTASRQNSTGIADVTLTVGKNSLPQL